MENSDAITRIISKLYLWAVPEVLNKIKRAGVIAYEKDYGTSQTNGIKPAN